jgi:hypothetical protein
MAGSFLQEDNGRNSSMRLMCFCSLILSAIFALITLLYRPESVAVNDQTGILIIFGFLVGAFAPKAVQKFAETKVG